MPQCLSRQFAQANPELRTPRSSCTTFQSPHRRKGVSANDRWRKRLNKPHVIAEGQDRDCFGGLDLALRAVRADVCLVKCQAAMRDLLNKLHKTKMILTGLVLVIVGATLLLIGSVITGDDVGFGELIPWNEFGGILIGGGILGIWIDHLFKTEQEAASEQQLRSILTDHAPAMRDAVLQAFAANHEDLKRVATPQTLDALITNSLALRLDSQDFADDIYRDLNVQAIEAPERWSDARVDLTISPHPEQDDFFEVTIRWEYSAVPSFATRHFTCVGDRTEYGAIAEAKGNTSAWYFKPDPAFTAESTDAFELLAFNVNGESRPIKRTSRKNQQTYTVQLGNDVAESNEPAVISYTLRTVTRKNGHLLFFEIEQPTENIAVNLDYTDADLAAISAIDLVPSVRPTRIEHSPEGIVPKTVLVEIDGWVFPRAGVAFVWTLDAEAAPSESKQRSNTGGGMK